MNDTRMIKINGETDYCDCGCNVFTVLEEKEDEILYRCNACRQLYAGTPKKK